AREIVGSTVVQKSGIQCYNCKEFGHVARESQKPKRAKDAAYHREKMLLYQELKAHYMYMAQLQEVSPDVADSGPIFDDEPLQKVSNDDHYNVEEIDQNDDDNDLATEQCELLASLIEKLKCEIDESKNRNKFLETSNKVLIEKLKEVIPTTSVSRPQLKSNPIGDRVMRNNSKGKKQKVEDQRRNVKLPKNKTSVTACNDSLNGKTLNVNSVSAMCDKCVLIHKHDMCVLHSVAKLISVKLYIFKTLKY
nr:hypothetical protein [Tanacetum cinerariifolium]